MGFGWPQLFGLQCFATAFIVEQLTVKITFTLYSCKIKNLADLFQVNHKSVKAYKGPFSFGHVLISFETSTHSSHRFFSVLSFETSFELLEFQNTVEF